MFNLRVVHQQGNKFDAMLYQGGENIGAVGKDDEGIYINLIRFLTVQDTIDLLKVVNGIGIDFYKLEVEIKYIQS